ncbi:hypothetical protein ACHAXT_003087 [Thalassiosira profunda]
MKLSLVILVAPLVHTISSVRGFAAEPSARIPLKGIDAAQFRHPLDRDLTSFVQKAPLTGLAEEAIRASLSLVEQGTRLDLLSSSVKVSQNQMPELYKSMEEAARVLDMDVVPELYIQSSSQANAFTLALQGRDNKPPIVVVTSALVDRCTDEEVQAIIGHELGHLKCSHSLYLSLGGLASAPLRGLPLVGSQAEQLLQQWRLAAEYSCDRAALLVAQDLEVVAGAMVKLFAGTSRATNTQAFIDQSREYEKLLKDANPMVRAAVRMQQRTHPLPVERVTELEKWYNSVEYKSILEGQK